MRYSRPFFVGLVLALVIVCVLSLSIGAMSIPLGDVIGALTGQPVESRYNNVLWHLRAPRVLLGILIGGALAVAGALLHGLFRNPLADPTLIGSSSGGALGAVFVSVIASQVFPQYPALGDLRLLPFAAFGGALIVTWLVRRLSASEGYTAVATLLLVGVAQLMLHRGTRKLVIHGG